MPNEASLANLKPPWPPGQSGNPAGRKTAGAYIIEHINAMTEADLTETELRLIAADKNLPAARRMAAQRLLRSLEFPDMADFALVVDGVDTLTEARDKGVNTSLIKKLKQRTFSTEAGTEVTREIELRDASGEEVDRLLDRTEGKPRQSVDLSGKMSVAVEPLVLVHSAPPPPEAKP